MLVEAHAMDTLSSLKFLQNCATIGEYKLYKLYAMPALKTMASIVTGLEQNKNDVHLGSSIVLDRVRGLLSNFIESNCDILIEFLRESVDREEQRMQFYLIQLILCK